jgi:long-chain fatty acid transport protein
MSPRILRLVLVLFAAPVFAAGFQLNVQSARGVGMAGAFTALADDASATYYNPAGLTAAGRGFEVMAGDSLILPEVHYTSPSGQNSSAAFTATPPPHVYGRVGVLDWLAFGLGVFTPFGNQVAWPSNWAGQYVSTQANLQTFDINANAAVRPNSRLSLAFGFNVMRGTVYLARNLNFIDAQGSVELGGGAWGWGYNAAMNVDIIENMLTLSATVRSPIKMDFHGNAHFTNVPEELNAQLYDQQVAATVQLPLTATFGLGFKYKRVKLDLDFAYTAWSTFTALNVTFLGNPALSVPVPKSFWDAGSVGVGAEIEVWNDLYARFGFMWDPTPAPQSTLGPDLPDSTRLNFSTGIGWRHTSGFLVDFGFQLVALLNHPSTLPTLPGSYGGTAEVLTLTFGWKHVSAPKAAATPAMPAAPATAPVPPATGTP